jgi:hypothetical protein
LSKATRPVSGRAGFEPGLLGATADVNFRPGWDVMQAVKEISYTSPAPCKATCAVPPTVSIQSFVCPPTSLPAPSPASPPTLVSSSNALNLGGPLSTHSSLLFLAQSRNPVNFAEEMGEGVHGGEVADTVPGCAWMPGKERWGDGIQVWQNRRWW